MGDWQPWRSGKGYNSRNTAWKWWGNVFYPPFVKSSILARTVFSFAVGYAFESSLQTMDIRNTHSTWASNFLWAWEELPEGYRHSRGLQPNQLPLVFGAASWFNYVYQLPFNRVWDADWFCPALFVGERERKNLALIQTQGCWDVGRIKLNGDFKSFLRMILRALNFIVVYEFSPYYSMWHRNWNKILIYTWIYQGK